MNVRRVGTNLVGLTVTFGVGWFAGIVWTSFQTGYSVLMAKQADEVRAAREAKRDARDRVPDGFVPLAYDPTRAGRLASRLN